jgi:hypothetical protein
LIRIIGSSTPEIIMAGVVLPFIVDPATGAVADIERPLGRIDVCAAKLVTPAQLPVRMGGSKIVDEHTANQAPKRRNPQRQSDNPHQ